MRTLVTGGAGYIGSHVARLLSRRGDEVVIVDDVLTGRRERVAEFELVEADLASDAAPALIERLCRAHRIDAVIHFAARKQVAESVARPAWYYQQNLGALANVLIGMERAEVGALVFSSSAAVYGTTQGAGIREADPVEPINPYGETKLFGERLVEAAVRASGLAAISLRYFNVAGAGWPELADRAALNLVPMVFERLDAGLPPVVFGDDYPTPDGTCVRDYVHVLDLARAHLAALDHLRTGRPGHSTFNVGTGEGTSVRQMIDVILQTAKVEAVLEIRPRRVGDPAVVVASPEELRRATGWKAELGIEDIVSSAWSAHVVE